MAATTLPARTLAGEQITEIIRPMKKLFQFAAYLTAALALASCAKEVESPVAL